MENTRIVSVFKTNISSRAEEICGIIRNLPDIQRCTLDMEDCDKVLRIESQITCLELVLTTVRRLGFFIEEMPD